MGYNTKNYTEQGGEVTHIGGRLVIDEGGSFEGASGAAGATELPYMSTEAVESDTVAKVRTTLNELIEAMKTAGLMSSAAPAQSAEGEGEGSQSSESESEAQSSESESEGAQTSESESEGNQTSESEGDGGSSETSESGT